MWHCLLLRFNPSAEADGNKYRHLKLNQSAMATANLTPQTRYEGPPS